MKKTKIFYCTPSIYNAGGVERVLTTKVNYLANQVDKYDVTIILTDGEDKKPFYQLSDKVKVINLDIGFEELWGMSFVKNDTCLSNPLPAIPEQKSSQIEKRVIAVGRYTYQKGIDLLLQAWSMVEKLHASSFFAWSFSRLCHMDWQLFLSTVPVGQKPLLKTVSTVFW